MIEQFKSHLKMRILAMGNQFLQPFKKLPAKRINNLDSKKIQDLLIVNYSKTFLEELRRSLEHAYTKEREKEKSVIAHSDKHRETVQRMHDITENITKVSDELSNLNNIGEQITTKIKNDLKLHPYRP